MNTTETTQPTEFEVWATATSIRLGKTKFMALAGLAGLVSSIPQEVLEENMTAHMVGSVLDAMRVSAEDFMDFMDKSRDAAHRGEDGNRAGRVSAEAYLATVGG